MTPFDITQSNVSFCIENGTFTCNSECANGSSSEANTQQCVTRTFNMYTTNIESTNITIATIFTGLSCIAIENHRRDICDVIYEESSTPSRQLNIL